MMVLVPVTVRSTSLVASLIVVAVTAAVLNEVLERRQRERWSVLAQNHIGLT